jgi:hypothetical protein
VQEGLVQFLQDAEELIGHRVQEFAAFKMPAPMIRARLEMSLLAFRYSTSIHCP